MGCQVFELAYNANIDKVSNQMSLVQIQKYQHQTCLKLLISYFWIYFLIIIDDALMCSSLICCNLQQGGAYYFTIGIYTTV